MRREDFSFVEDSQDAVCVDTFVAVVFNLPQLLCAIVDELLRAIHVIYHLLRINLLLRSGHAVTKNIGRLLTRLVELTEL